jgi:ABC-2 type transport system permease protein
MTHLIDTWALTRRDLVRLWRQPWFIAVALVQPVIWLLLFGALFQRVVDIPGFTGGDYKQYLVPGIVVMTAFFQSGWSGMPTIEDLERGVTDRLLVTRVRRWPLIVGRVTQTAIVVAIQSLIILGLAVATGTSLDGGPMGVLALLVVAALIAIAFAGLSNALALVARREESLIGAVQFLLMPLTFLSTTFMQKALMPKWMGTIADYNPVNWAVEAGREALNSSPDWGQVAGYAGLLAVFAVACVMLATRAFRAYQRSV